MSINLKVLTDAKRSFVLALPTRSVQPHQPERRKISRWIRFQLWFNTYRCVETVSWKGLFLWQAFPANFSPSSCPWIWLAWFWPRVASGLILGVIRVLLFLGIYWWLFLCGTNCSVGVYISLSTLCLQRFAFFVSYITQRWYLSSGLLFVFVSLALLYFSILEAYTLDVQHRVSFGWYFAWASS